MSTNPYSAYDTSTIHSTMPVRRHDRISAESVSVGEIPARNDTGDPDAVLDQLDGFVALHIEASGGTAYGEEFSFGKDAVEP